MESPPPTALKHRILTGGIIVWAAVSAVVFLWLKDDWFRAMADKAGFLALPPVDTLLLPALGMAAFGHFILAMVLLVTSRWWRRKDTPATLKLMLAAAPARLGRAWWLALAALLLVALAGRLPRMNLSLWGDESMAVNSYVAGKFKPVSAEDHQGEVRFIKTPWKTTAFADDGGGNNHFLYSILTRTLLEVWRDWTHQPKGAFSEPLLRFLPLLFGLASIGAMAGLMRRLGLPWTGILAAALLALHPWHLRFSTEARGYALMLFFFIMAIWAWVNALERGRWRDWSAVAACQFLALWSWKGVIYPLLGLNAAAALMIWLAPSAVGSRRGALGRWIACNVAAAALFIPLVAPAQIQMVQMLPRIARMGNLPADWPWIRNLLADTFMGCHAWILDATNPEEVCLDRWAAAHPVLVPAAFVILTACILSGFIFVARRSPVLGGMIFMIPAGGVVAAVHFKWGLNIELLRWYWFFLTPVIALLASTGAVAWWRRRPAGMAAGVVLLSSVIVISFPMCALYMTKATEDLRGALEIARGPGYRPWADLKASQVKTIWIWRHSRVYDPRGSTKVESVAQLHGYMKDADARNLDFYLIAGYPSLTRLLHPEVVPVIENPAHFEKLRTFWAQLPQNTLVVYRYQPGSLQLQTR